MPYTEADAIKLLDQICANPDNKGTVASLTHAVAYITTKLRVQDKLITELKARNDAIDKKYHEEKKEGETQRSSMEERLVNLESRSLAKNLVFKGLDMAGEEEDKEQTKAVIGEVLKVLEVSEDVLDDCFRFKRNPKSDGDRPPVILVRLKDVKAKGEIFRSVHKLKNSAYRISISNEYPQALRPVYKSQAARAAKLREESKNTIRTRLVLARGTIAIKVKGPNDAKFVFHDKIKKK